MVNRSTMVRISKHFLVGGLLAALTLPPGSTEAATPPRGTISNGSISWNFGPVIAETAVDLGVPDKCPPVVCDNYDLTVELPLPAAIFYQTMTARLTFKYTWSSILPTDLDIFAIRPGGDRHGPGSPNTTSTGPGEEDLTIDDPAQGVWHIRSAASTALLPTAAHVVATLAISPRPNPPPAYACTGTLLLPGVPEPSVGRNPTSVTAGDFNGDGKLDLAVTNEGSNNVSVLLGNGDGTFRAAADYSVGALPFSVTAGDFNGDGKLDLAVANEGSNNVSVLLGNGDGTFRAAADYSVGAQPFSVTAGDFNGDGKPDLAVANAGSNNVSVLLGNGDGTFQAAVSYAVGSGPVSLVSGDFNGDGKFDLAAANESGNNVSVLLGNGDGTFPSPASYGAGLQPWSVTSADFNGDGKPDLAVVNNGSYTVSVLLGNGDGTFQAAVSYSVGSALPVSVTSGDFNGDGKLDLAVALQATDRVSVLLGNGDGTFQAAVPYAVGSGPLSVASGDFNGDGNLDLATANRTNVSVLLGNGDGTFQPAVGYGTESSRRSVTIADFNGDGKLDLALAGGTNPGTNDNSVNVLLGNGDGTFQAAVSYHHTGSVPFSVTSGDFNGDGKLDLVTANAFWGPPPPEGSNSVSVLLGNGDGTFQAAVNYATGSSPLSVMSGDFNGDGKLDLVTANAGSSNVSILLDTGCLP